MDLLRHGLEPVPKRHQTVHATGQGLGAPVECLEDELRAGHGQGRGSTVASIDHGLEGLEQADEVGDDIAQMGVEAPGFVEVAVQNLDEERVEARLLDREVTNPRDHGSETGRRPVTAGSEVPRAVQLGQSDRLLRESLGGQVEGRQPVQIAQTLRITEHLFAHLGEEGPQRFAVVAHGPW